MVAGVFTQWHWNFGDPAFWIKQRVLPFQRLRNTFAVPGPYTVTLIIQKFYRMYGYNYQTSYSEIPCHLQISMPIRSCFQYSRPSFTDLSVPNATTIINYTWGFLVIGMPLSNQQNPTHIFTPAMEVIFSKADHCQFQWLYKGYYKTDPGTSTCLFLNSVSLLPIVSGAGV